jgi:hypothetical protein
MLQVVGPAKVKLGFFGLIERSEYARRNPTVGNLDFVTRARFAGQAITDQFPSHQVRVIGPRTLLPARAVENQAYVLAPAQGGLHQSGRRTYGHTMIVDPWGEVLALRPDGEGVVTAEIDTERVREVRAALPALANRRMH